MLDNQGAGGFDATALRKLQPLQHLEFLDIIDTLRAQGLHEHVDLPQLIVCGDQSSGKSSALAAISGVPFPKKDNLCTRFATEVVLRRADDSDDIQVSVMINPSSTRLLAERSRLESFTHSTSSLGTLPKIIEDAAVAMSLGSTNSAFFADTLRLEVRGPKMPQLTIVDLPGLVHAENKHQTADDIDLVNRLVEKYMSQERSIILAVVSAKNDYANQVVLTKARKVDPDGQRTLGIITKPDTLHKGSSGEAAFISLAQNHDVKFSLGWHVIRNQDSNGPTDEDRDQQETQFFQNSNWKQLPILYRGIESLQERLSKVLFEQIQRELPALISEIAEAEENTETQLTRMGRSRASLHEQRIFVMELGEKFSDLSQAACEGFYEHAFFVDSGPDSASRRLRAQIQNASIDFAEEMLETVSRVGVFSSTDNHSPLPTATFHRAKELVISHRGKELPGTFNPLLIGQIFRELSQTWHQSAREHVNNMWICAKNTVMAIFEVIAEDHVRDSCIKIVVQPELEKILKATEDLLDAYMLEFYRHPITYNHYLTETVQTLRKKRERQEVAGRLRRLFEKYSKLTIDDVDAIASAVVSGGEPNMDNEAAQQLADYAEAYYKVALKRLIDEIPAHVLEPALLQPLPKLLNSTKILDMPDEWIMTIGGESATKTSLRDSLQVKLDVLKRSSLVCKGYAKGGPAVAHEPFLDSAAWSLDSHPDNRVDTDREPDVDSDRMQESSDSAKDVMPNWQFSQEAPARPLEEAGFSLEIGTPMTPEIIPVAIGEDGGSVPQRLSKKKKKKGSGLVFLE